MKGRGGGKECEVLTHLFENSKLSHAMHVTKNKKGSGQFHNRVVCV